MIDRLGLSLKPCRSDPSWPRIVCHSPYARPLGLWFSDLTLFRIKICGITRLADARLAALAGADAIGLNFFPESQRYVEPSEARSLLVGLPPRVAKVGVFVNADVGDIQSIADDLQLEWIQLHGDEPPEMLAELCDRRIIRAFRLGDEGLEPVLAYLKACQAARMPDAVLLDAYHEDEYGGTGTSWDWRPLDEIRSCGVQGWVLAGGLTPFNVEDAVLAARPDAVDVASGVESKPGCKDALLIRAFVSAAAKAFSQLEQSDRERQEDNA